MTDFALPPDPAVTYARDLATLMADARDLLHDAAYAELLPAFDQLAKVLPEHLTPTAAASNVYPLRDPTRPA